MFCSRIHRILKALVVTRVPVFLSLFVCTRVSASAIDTAGGRYYNSLFSNVKITSGIQYGSAPDYTNTTVNLLMDIYQPAGDTVLERPVIVFAHGGAFLSGTREDSDVVELCFLFAQMGYVTASIDYRLGAAGADSVDATDAVIRAEQDMKAAVRFFRKDAQLPDLYHIHPNYIFAGGSSAGAFAALHLAYLDSVSKVPSYINLAALNGLDGNSGNSGYSNKVNGVINLCGALGKKTWIDRSGPPVVSVHGTADPIVPYGTGYIYAYGVPILEVDGSSSINAYAQSIGVNSALYSFIGAGHVPYYPLSSPTAAAYMDTTVNFVKAFLRPLLVLPSVTSIDEKDLTGKTLTVFPNPSSGSLRIIISGNNNPAARGTLKIVDIAGRQILTIPVNTPDILLNNENWAKGVYFFQVVDNDNYSIGSGKIVIE